MANKRYYWLKLHDDFFKSKRIKKLRKLGSDFVIIYLKMQLLSLQNNGILEFSGIEDNFASEIALDIDEDADKVQLTISYLQSCGLLECTEDNEFFLPYVEKLTGSETQSTIRSRKSRENKALEQLAAQKALQCNTDATKCNRDIDKDIDIDIDIDKEKDILDKSNISKKKNFVPPTLEECKAYAETKGYDIDVEQFFDYYDSADWHDSKGNKVKNWKQRMTTWKGNAYNIVKTTKQATEYPVVHETKQILNRLWTDYPRIGNEDKAKAILINWVQQYEGEEQKNQATALYAAISRSVKNYKESHADDPMCKYIKDLANWLSDEYNLKLIEDNKNWTYDKYMDYLKEREDGVKALMKLKEDMEAKMGAGEC